MNIGKTDYNPLKIEEKWRKKWEETKIYQPNLDTAKKPFYNLMMFPYPSAEGLHVGSVFTFTGVDTYGRFKRMQGYDVFEPMGLDGFGIHSENYALKVGRHPKEQAKISEKNFYRQLSSIGNSFDWSRKVETYDPDYYKWTQWIFIQLFKAGLAYRKKAPVNFCPSCKTVLSDEQVIDGKCERCSSIVEKKDLEQWFFKITTYADRLLNNLEKLDWTAKIKIAQKEWIGKREGLIFTAPVKDSNLKIQTFSAHFEAFYADTFVVIAPDHPLLEELLKNSSQKKEVMDFCKAIIEKRKTKGYQGEKEIEGIFTGKYIIDPVGNGDLPIWVASYALREYGTGIVKCSVHDTRDFAFAKKYGISLKPVLFPKDPEHRKRVENLEECFTDMKNGYLSEPSEFAGKRAGEVTQEIIKYAVKKGFAEQKTNYHLRDWLISRQRYWGPPIPLINCSKCGWVPVPDDQLPVLLPDVEDWKPKGDGTSPLANISSFVHTTCPNCGGPAKRETDVSDTFLDSAWYFFRYTSTEDSTCPWKPERAKKWLPVTMYIGGAEHSVLHLLYSRFLTMVFKDLKLISHFEEPFSRFYAHGLIIKDGAKMSKSKGNVVNPDEYLTKYGADVLRAYLRFVGPFDQGGDFRDSGIESMHRFLKRVWVLCHSEFISESRFSKNKILKQVQDDKKSKRMMHKTIKGLTDDLESLRFNTAIAKLMTYYNYLSIKKDLSKEEAKTLVLLLAPFTPFLSEELWEILGETYSVHTAPWPTYDPKMLEEKEVTIVVQINGKMRDTLKVESPASHRGESELKVQSDIEQLAKESANVQKHLKDSKIIKVIYVEGKIINFVVG